jgi:phospholipid/cholesterol/gamma-HCH transport system substrate-binding protein
LESKTNYTIVGLFVLILISGLITTLIWLSVGLDQHKYDIYAVFMHEAVSGLTTDAPVKFNGVKVGYVKSIHLNKQNPQQVILLLNISHDTPITQSTTATLVAQGITGTTHIGLSASSSDLTPLRVRKGETFPIIPSHPSLLNQIDSALKRVSENINEVSAEVKRVFNKENSENLKTALKNLRLLSDTFEQDRPQIHNILNNLNKSTQSFPEVTAELKASARSLSQETIPSANTLLKHLNNMAINLEKTSRDIKTNPSIIIRGQQPPKAGPGE